MTMKNIHTLSELYKGLIGVKSWLSRGFVLILALFTLGVGQMWADPWVKLDVSTGSQGTKTVGDELNGGSEWWFNYQTNGSWSTGTDIQVLIGTSSSSYSTVDASWYADDGDNKKVHANIGSFAFDKSGIWYAVGKYYASSKTAYTSGSSFTNNSSLSTSMSKSNSPYWTVNPPAVSSFSVARSGYLAGDGTSENPYLVASGSTLTLTASGNQAITDANSSVNYKFGSDSYSTTATKNITVSSSGSIAVKARCINSSASLNGTETSAVTIYYAPVSVKDISVYIYVGGCSAAEYNSVEMNGCTPYVGTKALTAVKINNQSAGAPKFTKNGNWLEYTFTNVTKVSSITCARSGGNIFTGEITNDVYYKYDGTALGGKCVPPANPTWGTAPASGAIGGSMTATVSGAPAGATITWSSTNTSAATVNSSGVISYEAAGNTTIKANVSWSASGDYCAGSYELSQAITVTSGATVSAELTTPEYVPTGVAGQVSMHITFTGTSSGWKYRVRHNWDTGYETAWLDASGSSANWTMTGGVGLGTFAYVVELYSSEGGTLVTTSAPVSVTGENTQTVNIAAGANGTVSPSGEIRANNSHVHPTITATPNEHYHFVNWTSSNAAASVADVNSATTTVTATAPGYTITANFAADQYTITYKDQGDVTYSGNNEGSLPATHTYGTATALVNGTKNGYNFVGWYTDASCTISAGSSIGATAKTSNFTLYAKWTEVMSTLSTANSYNAGDPSFAAPTKSVSSIGISTTATVTAHANELGYTLTSWTITGGTRTDGGAANANPITVRSNGDGAAVSVTANYEGSNTPVNIFLPNTGNSWNTSDVNWKFYKLPGESGNTVTLAVDINKYDYSGSGYKLGFNIYQADWGTKWWHNKSDGDSNMDAHNCTNWGFNTSEGDHKTNLDLNVSGTYTFTLTNSNSSSSQQLSVTYPDKSFIEGAFPTAWSEDAYTLTEEGNIQSVTINITSTGDKEFRLVSHGKLFGTSTKITKAANSQTLSAKNMADDGAVMTLAAYVTGEYTFSYNKSTNVLTVTFPIYNQVRISAASPEDATNVGNFNLSAPVSNVRTVTRSLKANTNYTFKVVYESEWYGYTGGTFTRNSSTSSNSLTTSTSGNDMTLTTDYAGDYTFRFNQSTKALSVDFPTAYTVTYGPGTSYTSMGSVSVSPSFNSGDYVLAGTNVTFTATPNLGYKFVGWYSDAGCNTQISTDNPYNVTINAAKEVYAKFDYRDLYIHADWLPYWGTAQMTQSIVNRAVYTYEFDPLNANTTPVGEPPIYNGGWHFQFVNTTVDPNNDRAYTYDGVQTPTGSGIISNDQIHKTADGNPTIQFYLTQKSKITITLTLQSTDDATKPTVNIDADPYYTITTAKGGSGAAGITISPASVEARSGANSAEITATIDPGYTFNNWTAGGTITINSASATTTTIKATGAGTLTANATANSYTVHFNGNGNTSGSMDDMPARTYGVAFNLTANGFTKTGYEFAGWATTADGAVAYANEAEVSNLTTVNNGTAQLYAKWTPVAYTVTLDGDEANHASAGTYALSGGTATFDAALPSFTGTLPTAGDGYAFMGFYSDHNGNGVQVIDASGNWIATAAGYTSGGNWVHEGNTTLYAYFKKAVITALTFDNPIVAPGTEVGVTATIAPAVTAGTKVLCWRVLYNNGNPLDPQPALAHPSTNKITFTAPAAPGTYKVEAKLHLNDCGGTLLSEQVMNFQVAGDHTVTVEYKCGDEEIASSTSVNGKPLEWTEITAPEDPFGYIFSKWKAGDGITIDGAVDGEKTTRTIQFKAVYDGKLTVVYTKKDFIYFKNTLGWSGDDIHVYFYNSSGYWDDSNGAGATGANCIGKGKMSLVDGETDIYYWDYGAGITGGAAAATTHVAFTNINKMTQTNFYECDVVYPTKGGNEGFSTGTPMFVPISQEKVTKNSKAYYYNKGYWTKYSGGTGYSVDIFFSKGGSYDKSVSFEEGDTPGMPFTATAYLTGGTTLGFKVHRSSGLYYYAGTDVTMANASTAKSLTYDNTSAKQTGITTNVTGEYIFTLTCAANGLLNVTVKYPASAGDYRLVYSDEVQTKPLISDVVPKVNNGKDTVSFFVRPGRTPVLKIQQATESAGTLSWSAGTDIATSAGLSSLLKDSVYNICLTMDGSGDISVENVEAYTGNFYIRTDAANNKWDNYRSADHVMTYSEYSEKNSDFTHYWMKFVGNNTNVKFVVANDYSPCISDTLIQQTYRGGDAAHVDTYGNLAHEANIRFMWHRHTNEIYRAYLSPAKENGSHYLVLRGTEGNLLSESGTPLRSGNNNGVEDNSIQFIDDENWIYETTVQSVPSSFVKLYAKYNNAYFYFKGANNDTWDASNAIQLVTGSGSAVKVRVIYDFKTDRLVAAYLPSGEISDPKAINADVMFIREHQGDIEQLTFSDDGKITNIKTAYAVMRFNKWTLNNKSTADGHAPLPAPLSRYERDIFYVSFPFDVNLNEVFGFGTYGVHWIMEYYDGESRAANGFWKDTPTYWRFITNRNGVVLKKNQGYILALDLDELGETSDVWRNNNERAELFFPSSGNLPNITAGTVTAVLEAHTCTINRNTPQGDRRIADSHWNIMGVPTYVNTSNVEFANTEWQTAPRDPATGHFGGPNFLYTWNSADNSLTPTSATGFTYHAMHSYTVQYYGNVSWTASVNPSSIVARQRQAPNAYEWCLELQQNEQMTDRTYVRMSNEEEVTTGFEFGYDMSKSMEWAKANIYTFIGSEAVAGNSMPLETVQTTVVPVGVYIKSDGEYTFAMPEGTNGVGITLIDTEANVRTSLSALDYTVTLSAGEYTNRFFLEISPVQNTPTDIENGGLMNGENGVRKVMIDGILYIVRDGKMYDARGARVE